MPIKPEPDLLAGPFAKRGTLGPRMTSMEDAGKLPPPKAPSGLRIEDRIGIQAPAEVIWEIVHDLSRWHEWNPTYPRAAGRLRIGEVLSMTLAFSACGGWPGSVRVTDSTSPIRIWPSASG